MYRESGEYVCDRCGEVIDGNPTVLDCGDYAVSVGCELEGIEMCVHCYGRLMSEQREIYQRLIRELKFNWRRDKE